jgi:hypothetical protein
MTDEQLDKLQDQASIVAERAFWDERHADIDDTALKDLIADYRRLRELERAVRAILMPMDVGNETHWYLRGYIKRAKRDAIGRLLEGEKPTIEDIGGSDPDFTGGKRTEDYVREMREGGRG